MNHKTACNDVRLLIAHPTDPGPKSLLVLQISGDRTMENLETHMKHIQTPPQP